MTQIKHDPRVSDIEQSLDAALRDVQNSGLEAAAALADHRALLLAQIYGTEKANEIRELDRLAADIRALKSQEPGK